MRKMVAVAAVMFYLLLSATSYANCVDVMRGRSLNMTYYQTYGGSEGDKHRDTFRIRNAYNCGDSVCFQARYRNWEISGKYDYNNIYFERMSDINRTALGEMMTGAGTCGNNNVIEGEFHYVPQRNDSGCCYRFIMGGF